LSLSFFLSLSFLSSSRSSPSPLSFLGVFKGHALIGSGTSPLP
jgi:hypothetical protein